MIKEPVKRGKGDGSDVSWKPQADIAVRLGTLNRRELTHLDCTICLTLRETLITGISAWQHQLKVIKLQGRLRRFDIENCMKVEKMLINENYNSYVA